MKAVRYSINLASLLILIFAMSCCSKADDPSDADDPINLTVEILSIDHEAGEVSIQATAENTVKYQLLLGNSSSPEQENTSGSFIQVFQGVGLFNFEIRAYGASGRFLKENRAVTIAPGGEANPIPLDSGYFTPMEYQGYTLVWNDEFSGNTVNSAYWSFETGDGCPNNCGWGNNELEYYRAENAWVEDDALTVEARMESFGGRNYTSTRMVTKGKKVFQYGRVDIRALLPKGQGLWPALWMLGKNISSVGWPGCGEIDIMEMVGGAGKENKCHGTIHWDNGDGHASYGQGTTVSPPNLAEAYHVFSITWDETSIKWFVDDRQYNQVTITSADMTEFHQEFFFIFNVAVGGIWPGNPDATTNFPQQMKVDYIRVFQKD